MAFVAAFAVYLWTLAPTVWVGDSGELTAAAWTLGTPHPTGYPLWLLLAKAFATIVPIGSVALRMNLFSALCAAGAAGLTSRALRRLGVSGAAAFGSALAFALLVPIWGEATVARTYPLAALVSAGLLALTTRWIEETEAGRSERTRDRLLVGHQLLLGFGLANHPMVAAHLLLLPVVVFAKERRAFTRPRLVLLALLALLPGLALYAWLPWRASHHPPLDYHPPVEVSEAVDGKTVTRWVPGDLASLDGFRSYVAREFHQTHHWAQGLGDHATILAHHAGELAREWTQIGVALALVGAFALARARRRSLVVGVVLLWLGNLAPLALHGAWWDVFLYTRYMTTGFVGVALLVGVGLDATIRAFAARVPLLARTAPRWALACALPLLLAVVNWRACDRSGGWLAADYARALLAELPPGAQLLSGDDLAIYPLCTLHYTEGVRPDVGLVNPIQLDGEADLLKALRAKRHGTPPPEAVRAAYSPDPTSDFEGLARDRCGLVYRLRLPDDPPLPPPPFAVPAIRGMRDDEADPFARSVVARIEADLADAAAVRGDDAQMRDRLERVVRIAPPRPWGNMQGAQTLIARVERRAKESGGIAADGLHDLDLARRLIDAALRTGDPRDASVLAVYAILGRTHYAEARRLRVSDPDVGFEHLLATADLLDEEAIRASAARALLQKGQVEDARARLERWCREKPGCETLERMRKELPPAPPK
jgi:hypothetical protein